MQEILATHKPKPLIASQEEDIERIANSSSHVGLTSQVKYVRALDVYNRAVARRLAEKKWKVIQTPDECGMITIRYDLTGNETLHNAVPPANWVKSPP